MENVDMENLDTTCGEAFSFIQKMFNDTLQERNRAYQVNQRLTQRQKMLKEQLKSFGDKFHNDCTELERRKKENESLRSCHKDLQEEIQALESELKEKELQQEDLEGVCEEFEKKKEVQDANCRMIRYFEHENPGLKEHLEMFKRDFRKLEKEGENEIGCLKHECENLQKKNAVLIKKKECLQDCHNKSCKNYEDAKQDFERACDCVVEQENELAACRERVKSLRTNLCCVEEEVRNIEKTQAEVGKLKKKLSDVEKIKQRQGEIDRQRQKEFERLRQKQTEVTKLKLQQIQLDTLLGQKQGYRAKTSFHDKKVCCDGNYMPPRLDRCNKNCRDQEMSQSCCSYNFNQPRPQIPRHRSNPCTLRSCASRGKLRSFVYSKRKSARSQSKVKKSYHHDSSDGLAPCSRHQNRMVRCSTRL